MGFSQSPSKMVVAFQIFNSITLQRSTLDRFTAYVVLHVIVHLLLSVNPLFIIKILNNPVVFVKDT